MGLLTWFGGPPWKPVSCNRWLRLRRSQQRAASSVDLKGQMGNAWEMKCKKGILSGFEDQLMSETPLHLRTFIEIPGFEWWFWHQVGENSEVCSVAPAITVWDLAYCWESMQNRPCCSHGNKISRFSTNHFNDFNDQYQSDFNHFKSSGWTTFQPLSPLPGVPAPPAAASCW